MKIKELITKINKSIDDVDLVTARILIEANIDILNQYRSILTGKTRELVKFLTTRLESGEEQLTRSEMATVMAVNSFATKFDVRSIKTAIKGKEQLLLKSDFLNHLNSDAKVILEGMGAIESKKSSEVF